MHMNMPLLNANVAILSSSFLNFIQKISFAYKDILDILVVAVLIFFLLILIRKTRSLPIFLGVILWVSSMPSASISTSG